MKRLRTTGHPADYAARDGPALKAGRADEIRTEADLQFLMSAIGGKAAALVAARHLLLPGAGGLEYSFKHERMVRT